VPAEAPLSPVSVVPEQGADAPRSPVPQQGADAPRPPVPERGADAPRSPAPTPQLQLRTLHRQAVERYAGMASYMAGFKRREQVNGQPGAEEIISFQFRKQPWSAHLKWLGGEHKGREVIYVKGQHGNKIHTLLAPNERSILTGKVVALDPDSMLIRSKTRHPITNAGIGPLIERFGALLDREDASQAKHVRYAGAQTRPEAEQPLAAVEQTIPAGQDAQLPAGGRRWWYFDPTTQLPTLVITTDAAGQEVEYYYWYRVTVNYLDDKDFDPAAFRAEGR